jgi:thiol-disulfide isomerase/thioredoxin
MKNLILFFIITLVLASCNPVISRWVGGLEMISENVAEETMDLPFLGTAPEIDNLVWLNTDTPLTLSSLKGKVVLLEMWTFGCINCQNVIPSLNAWHEKYVDEGLVIVGNHYPEFSYERDFDNLVKAVEQYEIEYPVVQDNDGRTWRAYKNRYWPALFLIDKSGNIRYTHIGEGAYDRTEQAIMALLSEPLDSLP